METEHQVDARYRGQSYELRVPADDWLERFHVAHEARYGYARRESTVELITVRVAATIAGVELSGTPPQPTAKPTRETAVVWWNGIWCDAVRTWRHALPVGTSLEGPALILEYSGTTWLPGGWRMSVDGAGSLDMVANA